MQISIPHSATLAAFLRRWQIPILAAITLLAAFLRFYRLPDMPPGLFSDEAWSGVMARDVLQTGHVQVFFATNQGVEPMVVYLTLPVVALLGDPIWQLRIPEALIGTLTIPALWWMCRELFGRRSACPDHPPTDDEYAASSLLGLGSALILATLFWHVNLSRIAMEPILVPLFMCLTFATLARALDTGRAPDYVLAGVVLAGNLYTYKAGYAVPLLAALLVGCLAIFEKGFLKREWPRLAIWVGAALLAYLPMMLFAAAHPGDFFMRFRSVTTESRFTPAIDVAGNAVKVLMMFFVRGDDSQRYNIPGRPAMDVLLAGLFLVGLERAIRSFRAPRQALPLVWLVVMSLPTLLSEFTPQWARAIGTTPAIALLCAWGGVGVCQAGQESGRRWLAAAATALVGLIVAVSGVVSVRDYFVTFSQASYLFRSFDEGNLRVAQYVNTIPASQRVYVVSEVPGSYTIRYVASRPYATYDGRSGVVYPAPGQEATSAVIFQQGKPAFKALWGARPEATIDWQVVDGEGAMFARALHLPPVDQPVPPPSRPLQATLGGSVRLLGYDLDGSQAVPGGKLALTLYWQALKPVGQDFTVFNHLVAQQASPGGEMALTGSDSQPIDGSYPTSGWLPGETILDKHVIAIPEDAPPGVYHLRVGMYLWETMQRLPALDGGGKPLPGDSIDLGTVTLAADN